MKFSSTSSTPIGQIRKGVNVVSANFIVTAKLRPTKTTIQMRDLIKTIYLIFAAIVSPAISNAQDMQKGFNLLENGDFNEAEVFFENILETYPESKTANICYARAVGLGGEAKKALGIFEKLSEPNPNDVEVLLNKAEAFLWLKDPEPAIEIYEKILKIDSTTFTAMLGLSNSLSMNNNYERAYEMILKTVKFKPENAQALTSQKFIRLAYANERASRYQEFSRAKELVRLNLLINRDDQESLMLLANIELMSGNYQAALNNYNQIKDELEFYIGASISHHMLQNEVKALEYAKKARKVAVGDDQISRTSTHYVSALLWSNEIKKARFTADSLANAHPTNADFVASQAEVSMYEADFLGGYADFKRHLKKLPESFKGNIGAADASHAMGMDNKAYAYAYETLKFHPGQKDAKNFISKLNKHHSPVLQAMLRYGKSNDGSSFTGWSIKAISSLSPLLSINAEYAKKELTSQLFNNETNTYRIGMKAYLSKRVNVEGSYANVQLSLHEGSVHNQSDIDVMMSGRISKSHQVSVGMQTDIQDFNSALLEQNIKTTHFVAKNIMTWKVSGLGWYSEYYNSYFTDGNSRNLLFTSVYKGFDKQDFKTGVNYLNMAFAENKPLDYFSPTSYQQVELFVGGSSKKTSLPVTVAMDLAAGYQFLGDQPQFTWRGKASIEKEVGRLHFSVVGTYSSISAVQSNGFAFGTLSATIKWQIMKKPLFRTK